MLRRNWLLVGILSLTLLGIGKINLFGADNIRYVEVAPTDTTAYQENQYIAWLYFYGYPPTWHDVPAVWGQRFKYTTHDVAGLVTTLTQIYVWDNNARAWVPTSTSTTTTTNPYPYSYNMTYSRTIIKGYSPGDGQFSNFDGVGQIAMEVGFPLPALQPGEKVISATVKGTNVTVPVDGNKAIFNLAPTTPTSWQPISVSVDSAMFPGEKAEVFVSYSGLVSRLILTIGLEEIPTPKPQITFEWPPFQAPPINPNMAGDPLFTSNGETFQSVTDLAIPGRGFPFQFTRTYRSQIAFNGPMGYGWDFNYNERLVDAPAEGKVIYFNGAARRDEFIKEGNSYRAPTGFYVILTKLPDGTFTLQERNGTVKVFAPNPFSPGLYTLNSITDRNGNRMAFNYNAAGQLVEIIDTLGRSIRVRWNADGRLSELEDFRGRKIKYGYDSDFNLITATTPATDDYPQGKTTTYTYSKNQSDAALNHNILTVTDPKGQVYLTNHYDQNDRVIKQDYGNGSYFISYVTNPDGTLTTTVIDRKGNKRVWYHNRLGNAVKEEVYTQAQGIITTQWEYNENGERTKTILPQGNLIENTFDITNTNRLSQGNLLQITRRTAQGAELTTHFSYEPNYNQVKSTTNALGRTTNFYFDYEEATLGDLNGDVITSQAHGNIVKILYPPVTVGLAARNGPQAGEAKFWYNEFGQLTRSIDPMGYVDAYEYYPNGYLFRIIRDMNNANASNSFEYDAVGNITAIYDGKGNKTAFLINPLNQVTETVSRLPFGYRVKFHYDANGNIKRIEIENKDKDCISDPQLPWIVSTYGYDILDNLISKTEQVSNNELLTTNYGYDLNGNRELITQPEGNQMQNVYDERNLLWETFRGYGSSEWSSTRRSYDTNGNLVNITDGNGHTMTYLIDGFDRMIGYVDALGNRMEQELDAVGNVVCVRRKDASGVILSETKYLYDELDRNYETQEWLDTGSWASTQNEFDKNSRIVKTIDANGHQSLTVYDGLGRVVRTEDHMGNKVEYSYDANNNVTQVKETETTDSSVQSPVGIDTTDYVTNNVYDTLDRLIKSTNPIRVIRGYGFDSRNNLTYNTDGEGNTTSNIYDGVNRLISVIRDLREGGKGDGAIIKQIKMQYRWDRNSRLLALIDDNGNTTSYLYDALNRRKKEFMPDGTAKELSYDAADNIKEIRDANGTQITQIYDDINRLVRKDVVKGIGVIGGFYEEFAYDGLSRMTSARNDYSTVGMKYDSLSRLLEESQSVLSVQSVVPKSVVSAYDLVGNRISLTYPSGKVINFTPDELNRIKQIASGQAPIASYSYTGPFRVKERTYANGSKLSVNYDANRRITEYNHSGLKAWMPKEKKDNGEGKGKGQEKEYAGIELRHTTVAFNYGYDKEDNRLYEKRAHQNGAGDAYTYDSLYRLVAASYDVPNPGQMLTPNNQPLKTQSWQLDGVDNWQTSQTDSTSLTYQINPLNQYTSINGTNLQYDKNGNCIFDGYNTLTYDYANRPVIIENARYKVEIKYDALGRRIEKKVTEKERGEKEEGERDGDDEDNETNNEQLITNYYYDGARVIEEYDQERELKRSYIYGTGLDEVLVMQRGEKQYWYHENALGSITHISNEKGEVVESYKYTVYGKVTIYGKKGKVYRKSHIANHFLFTEREYDQETGLDYYRSRYYSPELGRFLQRDSYKETTNLYEYVYNSPLNFTDPFGLTPKQPPDGLELLLLSLHQNRETVLGELTTLNDDLDTLLYLQWIADGSKYQILPSFRSDKFFVDLLQPRTVYGSKPDPELLSEVNKSVDIVLVQIDAKEKYFSQVLDLYENALLLSQGETNYYLYKVILSIPIIGSAAKNWATAYAGYDIREGELTTGQRIWRLGEGGIDVATIAGGMGVASKLKGFVGGRAITLRGVNNPIVKASIERGNLEHAKFYKWAQEQGMLTNKAIPGTRFRPDAMDLINKHFYELKSLTPTGKTAMKKALEKYGELLPGWKGIDKWYGKP